MTRKACSADSAAVVRYPRAMAASRQASRTARSSSTIRRFNSAGPSARGNGEKVLGAIAAVIKRHLGLLIAFGYIVRAGQFLYLSGYCDGLRAGGRSCECPGPEMFPRKQFHLQLQRC